MRRVTALPVCAALLLALCIAPFQHVHLAVNNPGHGHVHDVESAIVHVHFGSTSLPPDALGTLRVTDSDAEHAQSLDTFTALAQSVVFLFFYPESHSLVLSPLQFSAAVVEAIEPKAHDPPVTGFSIPRAPPA
jgi:hypothetical protein